MRKAKFIIPVFIFVMNSANAGIVEIKDLPDNTESEYVYTLKSGSPLIRWCSAQNFWGTPRIDLPVGYSFFGSVHFTLGPNDAATPTVSDARYPGIQASGMNRTPWYFNSERSLGLHWLCGGPNPRGNYTIVFPQEIKMKKIGGSTIGPPPNDLIAKYTDIGGQHDANYVLHRTPELVTKAWVHAEDSIELTKGNQKQVLYVVGPEVKGAKVCIKWESNRKSAFSVIDTQGREYNDDCLAANSSLVLFVKASDRPPIGDSQERLTFRVIRQ